MYQSAHYPSPINFPEGHSGKISLKHRVITDTHITVIGARQAFLRGQRPAKAPLAAPLTIHELIEKDQGVWMTDLPEELNQIYEALYTLRPRGDILVGGLGLGLLPRILLQNNVNQVITNITVVEKNKNIIKLCGQNTPFAVVRQDIMQYLLTSPHRHDVYMLDTWQGTSEGTWWGEVLPLRRASRRRWGMRPVIHCWAEDIMLGQVGRMLMTKAPPGTIKPRHYAKLPTMTHQQAKYFVQHAGMPAWEKKYGVLLNDTGD